MAITTDIEWCDSTLNLQMGCDGCELWNPKAGVKHCYAGTLTARHAGKKGWPVAFDQPAVFLERLEPALRWPDLRGKERPAKPWLNSRPRMVFLNDMGDTYTESLPVDWLAPVIERMGQSPHVWMVLTKRPQRMLEAAMLHGFPRNFMLGASVTEQGNAGPRIRTLLEIARLTRCLTFLSIEPLLGPVDLERWLDPTGVECHDVCPGRRYVKHSEVDTRNRGEECYPLCPDCGEPAQWTACDEGINFVIVGGESGPGARPCQVRWVSNIVRQCEEQGVPVFVKQLGSKPVLRLDEANGAFGWPPTDRKGGEMAEWPEALRVREMPIGLEGSR